MVLPLGVLVLELLSTFCGGVFFDPVPTAWHAGILLLVPAVVTKDVSYAEAFQRSTAEIAKALPLPALMVP